LYLSQFDRSKPVGQMDFLIIVIGATKKGGGSRNRNEKSLWGGGGEKKCGGGGKVPSGAGLKGASLNYEWGGAGVKFG